MGLTEIKIRIIFGLIATMRKIVGSNVFNGVVGAALQLLNFIGFQEKNGKLINLGEKAD